MNFQNYIDGKKQLESLILAFLDQENTEEEDENQNLFNFLHNQNIGNKDELTAFFHFISQISADHHRKTDFHAKIDQLISHFSANIKNNFTNLELFHIFRRNKRILLYLIQNNLITLDTNFVKTLAKPKYRRLFYLHYFYPEIKEYLTDDELKADIEKDIKKYSSSTFQQLRQRGENEEPICEIIRNDSITDFISHVSKERNTLFKPIQPSIFETNHFLTKNSPSLLDYSAFYGSIEIFQHLLSVNSKISPETWHYAVHGRSLEIIGIMEGRPIRPKDYTFGAVVDESFKCHHSEVTDYLIEKLAKIRKGEEMYFFAHSIKYYNYAYFPDDLNNQFTFCCLCHADYLSILNELVKLSKKNFVINNPITII